MNGLLFSLFFFVNSEPIKKNLNGIFANKYGEIQYWLRNYEKLQIVWSHFFTLLKIFVYIWSNSKLFGLSVFSFDLFDKWQIGIRSLQYFVNSKSHSNFEFKVKIKIIAVA